jgi:small-conductance mechanosensitive channel
LLTVRRASVSVYLDYKEDTGRAMSVILNTVKSVPGVASEPAPSMRLHDLSLDCVQIEARLWADSHRSDLMNTASAARVAIVDALKAAGIRLPDRDARNVTITESRPHTS